MALTVGNVHVNAPLSQLARLYRPLEDGFIADQVCPMLPVVKESDLYYVWTQGDFFAVDVPDRVADRAAPRRIEFEATTESYFCERRELAWDISDRERRNADDQLRLETNKQRGVLGRLLLLRERRVSGLLLDSGQTTTVGDETITGGLNAAQDAASTARWDAAATTFRNIQGDVTDARQRIRQAIGQRPNTVIIPEAVAEGMGKSQFFTQLTHNLDAGQQTDQVPLYRDYPLIPRVLFGLRVLVPCAIYNTAAEGQTASYSDIWADGEQVVVLYVTPGPAVEIPSVAYTFQAEPRTTRQWRDDERRVDAYAVGMTIDELVTAPFAGAVITNCLT